MVKKGPRISVERHKFSDYTAVAKNFSDGAKLAIEFEYWNAAGVLIVHSAIAYADALTIKFGSVKSRGDDHLMAAHLIEEVIALDADGKKALNQFRHIIEEKNLVSYSGEIYNRSDVTSLWKLLERYQRWAEYMLQL